ncbi:hypothetical protein RvY_04107 [Ramazzottius varieornatus]|uniref:Uncharacterized protein n=1 Tax=Ramazzottius varieornatus TaxID=947166 RepID=A0A1D1UR69_RAMVA|nr:hypothetical protein RvY_04107 [Ramazzottius varieornatus]
MHPVVVRSSFRRIPPQKTIVHHVASKQFIQQRRTLHRHRVAVAQCVNIMHHFASRTFAGPFQEGSPVTKAGYLTKLRSGQVERGSFKECRKPVGTSVEQAFVGIAATT